MEYVYYITYRTKTGKQKYIFSNCRGGFKPVKTSIIEKATQYKSEEQAKLEILNINESFYWYLFKDISLTVSAYTSKIGKE
jgi:hypothetical protein